METTLNMMSPETHTPGEKTTSAGAAATLAADLVRPRSGDDVVRWGEFRLALWMGAFTLTAVLGGSTFLYTAIMGMQVAMQTQFAELRTEMEVQHAGIRDELRADIDGVRDELRADINGVRDELRAEINGMRDELRADINGVRVEVINLRERVIRIETRLETTPGYPLSREDAEKTGTDVG